MDSFLFPKEVFTACSSEEKNNISKSLDNTIKSFIPLQDDLNRLKDLNKILSVRQNLNASLEANGQCDEIYKVLATESLLLLEKHVENNQEFLQMLLDIFGSSLSMLHKANYIEIIATTVLKCKSELSNFFERQWCDGSNTENFKPRTYLDLLENILTSVLQHQIKDDLFDHLHDDSMHTLLLCLSSCNIDSISSHTTMSILPKLMDYEHQPHLLEKLWELVASQVNEKDGKLLVEKDSVFMLLCSLIEFYLPAESSSQESFILQKNEFWKIIQCGIIHHDQVIRKQSRYLLKRAIDFVSNNKISIKTDYFNWNHQTSSLEDWEQFFLVIESLEEKQVHLIKPMFPLVDNLFKTIDMNWALSALYQVINHDNNFIVKWGINFFLQLTPTEDTNAFIFQNILPALNNAIIYHNDSINLSEISIGLRNLFQTIATKRDVNFFKQLLKSLASIPWSPVPLYQVSQAFGNLPTLPAWDTEDLVVLKKFLIEALASHNIFLRAAAQSMLLRGMLSLTNTQNLDMSTLADVLATFNNSESLSRGHKDWTLTVDWLQNNVSPETAENFVAMSINYVTSNKENSDSNDSDKNVLNCHAIARTSILLCDAQLLSEENFSSLMKKMIAQLDGCETRLYVCQRDVDASLDLLTNLLAECGTRKSESDKTRDLVLSIVSPVSSGIFSYLHTRLSAPLQLHDFHAVQIYTAVLAMIASSPKLFANILHQVPASLETATAILNNKNLELAMQKYFAAKFIEWCSTCCINKSLLHASDSSSSLRGQLEAHLTSAVIAESLNNSCPRPAASELTRDLQTFWGRITSGQLKALWSTVNNLLHLSTSSLHESLPYSNVISQAVEGIEVGGPEILPPIMAVLAYFLYKEQDFNLVKSILNKCYSLSFEYRKTELFWLAIKGFIKMTFSKHILARSDLIEELTKFAEALFDHSQLVSGLCNLVVQQVTSQVQLPCPATRTLVLVLANGLTFGPMVRKDQKIINQSCLYIESLGDELPANSLLPGLCKASQEVRACCFSLILRAVSLDPALLESVARELLDQEQVRASRKTRYFADSHMHRIKHRTAQAFLLMEASLSQDLCCELLSWGCSSLVEDSHQPSVRYLLEWLIMRLLQHVPVLEQTFLESLTLASVKRQGSMASFISILYLWVLASAEQGAEMELVRLAHLTSQLVLPWTMVQHYNIRLYAQVALLKTWSVCGEYGVSEVVEKFSSLQEALQTSLEQGSGAKNALRLQEEFYFSVFSPTRHFTLETIFSELPRLSNVSPDEWILPGMFSCNNICPLPLTNPDSLLTKCSVANWIIKSAGGGPVQDEEEEGCGSVVQRKVTPWKSMFPEQAARERRRDGTVGGLVVVASLLDRPPNLGGLSRTCEVLAASELVLGNVRVTEDPMFQSLSVSAEKWINVAEVRPHQLPAYLAHMKRQGYTLIAAEQTSRSVPLQHMPFPKQTLLLLGNEKEGIPAELLPLLDVCVEVPQQGVIRSLNVHVTGALFIWHYFQQHHLTPLPPASPSPT